MREVRGGYGLGLDTQVKQTTQRRVLRRVGDDEIGQGSGDAPAGFDALQEEDDEVVSSFAHEGGDDALAGVVVEGGVETAFICQGLGIRGNSQAKPEWTRRYGKWWDMRPGRRDSR